jgi:hypothetical protein
MSAGFHEWVNDWYDPQYYKHSSTNNPRGPAKGKERVVRGFFGAIDLAMKFRRLGRESKDQAGTWTTKFDPNSNSPDREIPYTKYSSLRGDAFRCAVHRSKPVQ